MKGGKLLKGHRGRSHQDYLHQKAEFAGPVLQPIDQIFLACVSIPDGI